jgi:hypothetical protein
MAEVKVLVNTPDSAWAKKEEWRMKARLRWRFLAAVFTLGVLSIPAVWSGLTPAVGAAAGGPVHSPAASHSLETSPLQSFAEKAQQLGITKFATSFAGARLAGRKLDIYVVAGKAAAFLHAVAAADQAGLRYTVISVPHSWAGQMATLNWLTRHTSTLNRQGIRLNTWAPSPADDAVQVQLRAPGSRQLQHLASTIARLRAGRLAARRPLRLAADVPVTAGSYSRVAAAALRAEVPSAGLVTVSPIVGAAIRTASGAADYSPFYGGDNIFYELSNSNECTGGFPVKSGSTDYMLTAAHCSYEVTGTATGHDFYTCATSSSGLCNYDIGHVSAIFWNENCASGAGGCNDFELINSSAVSRSEDGYIWTNKTSTAWGVNGYIDPTVGALVTTDGWQSGAVYDNTVDAVDGCFSESYSGGSHNVCNDVITDHGGSTSCRGGDSGSPILQRESTGTYIKAVAILDAVTSTNCYGELISWIRTEAGVILIWYSG